MIGWLGGIGKDMVLDIRSKK